MRGERTRRAEVREGPRMRRVDSTPRRGMIPRPRHPTRIDHYVANFTTVASGKKFNPHVTIGVAPEA